MTPARPSLAQILLQDLGQDTVILQAPPTAIAAPVPKSQSHPQLISAPAGATVPHPMNAAMHQANYLTIANYLAFGTALYGSRGTRPKGAVRQEVRLGYQ